MPFVSVCVCVRVFRPRFLSQDPSVLCYHGDGMLPIFLPLNPRSPPPPPLFFPPSFTHWFQCYHGDTCLSPLCLLPVSHAALSHWVSLSACLSASLFVCLPLGACVPLACLSLSTLCLFVYLVCVLCICMAVCLVVFPCSSLSVFAFRLTLFSLFHSG